MSSPDTQDQTQAPEQAQKPPHTLKSLFEAVHQERDELRVTVHSGVFHIDEAICLAMVKFLLDDYNDGATRFKYTLTMLVRRSRDPEVIQNSDIVIDVGGIYDPDLYRYDHHQANGAGRRPSKGDVEGTLYSAAGLFWKDFGVEFSKSVARRCTRIKLQGGKPFRKVARIVDSQLIEGICALDTGDVRLSSTGAKIQSISSAFSMLNPVEIGSDKIVDDQYDALQVGTKFVQQILIGAVKRAIDSVYHRPMLNKLLEKQNSTEEPRVLVLNNTSQAWRSVLTKNSGVLVVIQPAADANNPQHRNWNVLATSHKGVQLFDFPAEWYGVESGLDRITGVPGALYCHNTGFAAGAKTREGAIALVRLALIEWDKTDHGGGTSDGGGFEEVDDEDE